MTSSGLLEQLNLLIEAGLTDLDTLHRWLVLIIELLLTDLGGLGDLLVQILHALGQGSDLLTESGDGLLGLLGRLLEVCDLDVDSLCLSSVSSTSFSLLVLGIVDLLLLTKQGNHVINHLDGLLHADLLALQR